MPRSVIVEYPKGENGQGARFEVASAAVARKVHPKAKIVEFADSGEPYEEPQKTKAEPEPTT